MKIMHGQSMPPCIKDMEILNKTFSCMTMSFGKLLIKFPGYGSKDGNMEDISHFLFACPELDNE